MNKETFLKALSKNLRYLSEDAKKEELLKYENLSNYNIDPIKEANKIYNNKGLNIQIKKMGNLFNSVSIIINELQSKDKNRIINILKKEKVMFYHFF